MPSNSSNSSSIARLWHKVSFKVLCILDAVEEYIVQRPKNFEGNAKVEGVLDIGDEIEKGKS